MRIRHDDGCLWWKDWHSCSCGFMEEEIRQLKIVSDQIEEAQICAEVIPGTFIMCGEGFGDERQYCSTACWKKAQGKKP